jgi:hypothetical protein
MTVEIPYTPEMFRRANRRYILRLWRKQFLLATLVAIALLALVVFGSPTPMLRALILVTVTLIPVLLVGGYFARLRHSLSLFKKLDAGKVRFTFDETGVSTESTLGKSTLVWAMFTELWEFPDEFLLLYVNAQFITLPKAHVPERAITRIRERLASERSDTPPSPAH